MFNSKFCRENWNLEKRRKSEMLQLSEFAYGAKIVLKNHSNGK